jgi:hypothetical protein
MRKNDRECGLNSDNWLLLKLANTMRASDEIPIPAYLDDDLHKLKSGAKESELLAIQLRRWLSWDEGYDKYWEETVRMLNLDPNKIPVLNETEWALIRQQNTLAEAGKGDRFTGLSHDWEIKRKLDPIKEIMGQRLEEISTEDYLPLVVDGTILTFKWGQFGVVFGLLPYGDFSPLGTGIAMETNHKSGSAFWLPDEDGLNNEIKAQIGSDQELLAYWFEKVTLNKSKKNYHDAANMLRRKEYAFADRWMKFKFFDLIVKECGDRGELKVQRKIKNATEEYAFRIVDQKMGNILGLSKISVDNWGMTEDIDEVLVAISNNNFSYGMSKGKKMEWNSNQVMMYGVVKMVQNLFERAEWISGNDFMENDRSVRKEVLKKLFGVKNLKDLFTLINEAMISQDTQFGIVDK